MELINITEERNNIIKKHQKLVHDARYRLSELGIKVLSVLISQIKKSDTEFTQYLIKIEDFKELIGSDSKNTYKYAHSLIEELMSNPIKIGDEQFNWVSYGKHIKGDGVIAFEVHRLLKPYLLELQSNFLQYNIINILPLKSGYIIRLYELCKDHYNEGTRYKKEKTSVIFELKIERIRELFEIPTTYQYSSHIKKRILDKAVKQFQEKTDITISYKEQKMGRKVDRIIITVKKNNKGSNDYLKSRKAFIYYIREVYKPRNDVYPIIYSSTNKEGDNITMKVDLSGKLYAIKNGNTKDLQSPESNKWWDFLYKLAQDGELAIQQTMQY